MEPDHLTRAQVREVERIAIEEYGIPAIVLMENAGRGAAIYCDGMMPGAFNDVLIVCGSGNNAGDGYVAARHMAGCLEYQNVTVLSLVPPESLPPDARVMALAAKKMRDIKWSSDVSIIAKDWEMVVDAIFGTGLNRAPRDSAKQAIDAINALDRKWTKVVSLDTPSGLDCDTGKPLGSAVRASMTLTFVAPKTGFAAAGAEEFTGQVVRMDIGAPREILERVLASGQ